MAGSAEHAGLAPEQALVMATATLASGQAGMRPLGGRSMWLACAVAALITIATATAPGWSGVFAVAWLALVMVAGRYPAIGLGILAFTVPLQDRFVLSMVAGEPSITGYAAWAFIAGTVVFIARRQPVIDRPSIAIAIVVVALVASWASGGPRVATWYDQIYHWLLPLLVYLAVRASSWKWSDGLKVLMGLALGLLAATWEAVQQVMSGSGPASFEVDGLLRVFGPFSHPNTLASYLVIALPPLISVGMVLSVRSRSVPVLVISAGAVAGLIALVLTQSRGGWLAFAAAMLIMLALSPRSVQRASALAAAAMVLIIVATGLSDSLPGVGRFATIPAAETGQVQVTTATWGQQEREAHWGAARSMVGENPVFGVGAGEFNDSYREHTPVWRFRIGRGHAHNGYLHLGAQAGVPGLAAFSLWVGTMLVVLARRLATRRLASRAFVVGALGSVSAFAVHSIFEYIEVRSLLVLLAIVVAIALNIDQSDRAVNPAQSEPALAGQSS